MKLNLLFKLSYLSSTFALTLGHLNPALNDPALKQLLPIMIKSMIIAKYGHRHNGWACDEKNQTRI